MSDFLITIIGTSLLILIIISLATLLIIAVFNIGLVIFNLWNLFKFNKQYSFSLNINNKSFFFFFSNLIKFVFYPLNLVITLVGTYTLATDSLVIIKNLICDKSATPTKELNIVILYLALVIFIFLCYYLYNKFKKK